MNALNQTFLLIEDQVMLASLIERQVHAIKGVDNVIVAKTGEEALKLFKSNYIDFVLLDLMLPDMDGMNLIPKFKEINGRSEIIVISAETDVAIIKKVAKLGIGAFVSKMRNENELINAILSVRQGKRFFSDNILDLLLNEDKAPVRHEAPYIQKVLTKREIEVLGYIADEMTSKQIADLLLVSRHTVETHKRRMMQKLKVTNTAGLIKVAYEKNILNGQTNK
jgi:DNA-binding NarL/FixJ family response regulator